MNLVKGILGIAMGLLLGMWLLNQHHVPSASGQTSATPSWSSRLFGDGKVHYRLGAIDARFHLSRAELSLLTREAIALWEGPMAKQMFVEDEAAPLTISLVYDQIQETSNQQVSEEEQLSRDHSSHESQQQEYETQKARLQSQQQTFEEHLSEFQQRQQQYQDTLSQLRGQGADRLDEARMEVARVQLEQQQQSLQREQDDLNQSIQSFNANASELNQAASQFNEKVDRYNQRYSGRSFHKGVYDGKSITIYEFRSRDELRLVLAHELGHALGLNHSNDPQGLMYPVLQAQNLSNFHLASSDISLVLQRH